MHDRQHIRLDEVAGIATVQIARPDVRNAFSFQTIEELTQIAHLLRRRADVHAVILTGLPTVFSVGQDLRNAPAPDAPKPSLLERRTQAQAGPDLLRAWEEIEAITIAAIEGHCIGGACALALACDFRVMARSASLRLPEVPLGMNMPWHTIPRVTALVGPARAKRFVLFGAPLDAETCLDWGLAEETVDDGAALETARAWADRVAALPPLPARMTKQAVNAAAQALTSALSFMDRDQHLLTLMTEDLQEGIAAFRDKRKPRFTGN